jgi:hypothetical protein
VTSVSVKTAHGSVVVVVAAVLVDPCVVDVAVAVVGVVGATVEAGGAVDVDEAEDVLADSPPLQPPSDASATTRSAP